MSDPAAEATKFVTEVWGLQGVAYLVIALRYYSKVKSFGWRGLGWDDFLMFLATIVYTAESVAAYFVVAYWKGVANNGMTDTQRVALDPNSEEYFLRQSGSKTHVIGLILYATLLWLLKGCWLVYYARLTDGVHNMDKRIKWGIVIIVSSYISCLLVAFLKCIPFQNQWQINPNPGNSCLPAVSLVQTIFVVVMNSITDFYLMGIPLPVVWKSHLPLRKKIVLCILFSGGLLELAFGIIRAVSILTLGDTDPAQSGYWSVRESFVSTVLTNLPMVYPLFKQYMDKTRSSISRSKAGTGNGSDQRGYKLESYNPPTIGGISSKPKRTDDSILQVTKWDSKENIVGDRSSGRLSSGDEESIDLPKHEAHQARAVSTQGQSAILTKSNSSAGRQPQYHSQEARGSKAPTTRPENQIVVTTEYSVTDGGKGSLKRPGQLDI